MHAIIAMLVVGAGFTKAELEALPKPDPHFFDSLLDDKQPARARKAGLDERSPVMKQLLAQKALRRRQRVRQQDAWFGYDPGMQAVMGHARQVYLNSFRRVW